MIVYIYDNKTNEKVTTWKGVLQVVSKENSFDLHVSGQIVSVPKDNIKLVVYGF